MNIRQFRFRAVAALLLIFVLPACHREAALEPVRFGGQTMGTTWSVVLLPVAGTATESLHHALQQRLDRINRLMSTYDPNSEVSRFNNWQGESWFPVSPETAEVISLSLEISDMTGGAFDITVGPLVDLWGFGPPQRGARLPEPKRIEQTLAWVGYDKLELQSEPPAVRKTVDGLRIDLSAVAKGYAVDSLAELLKQHGIDNFLVEVGGELQLSGVRMDGTPWKIAIEKPVEEKREVETIIPLTGTALATSGNYRNFYVEQGQRYAHTIDPRQGRPIRHKLASATVLDPSCARADALATALMVLGETEGLRLIEDYRIAAYLIVYEKERLVDYASPAFTSRVERVSK